jgi:hypothetical protein
LEEYGVMGVVIRIGIPDEFVEQGAPDILKGNIGLNAEGIFYHTKYLSKCKAAGRVCNEECRKKNLCRMAVKVKEKG